MNDNIKWCPFEPIVKDRFCELRIDLKVKPKVEKARVLCIRNDLIWDMAVVAPAVSLMSMKKGLKVDVLVWPRNNLLFDAFFGKTKSVNSVESRINHNDYVWYWQEKTSVLLRLYLWLKCILNLDIVRFVWLFVKYDIVVDFVWKRRYHIAMYIAKILRFGRLYCCGIYRSITHKILDGVLYKSDTENIVDQYIQFVNSIVGDEQLLEEFETKKKWWNIFDISVSEWDYYLLHIWYWWENSRKWKSDNWQKMILYLLSDWQKVTICYGPMESEMWDKLVEMFHHHPSFKSFNYPVLWKLVDLIANSKLYIWIDSWPFHIADVLGKKTIVLFSRENHKTWWWWNPNVKTVKNYNDICMKRLCPSSYCINQIKCDEVIWIVNDFENKRIH